MITDTEILAAANAGEAKDWEFKSAKGGLPGSLLISYDQLLQGGFSECRNRSLQLMFMLIGHKTVPGSYDVEPEPRTVQETLWLQYGKDAS